MTGKRVGPRVSERGLVGLGLGFAVLLHLALGILLFDPKPFVGGENAGHLVAAESIRSGAGYRDISSPDRPAFTSSRPGYPLILAAVGAFTESLVGLKAMSLVFTAASLPLFLLLARRRLGDVEALALTVVFAFNPVLLYYSHWVLPVALVVALTMVALLAGERTIASAGGLPLVIVLGVAAYSVGAPAMPLLLALALPLAWRGSLRPAALVTGTLLAVAAAWWLWLAAAGGAGDVATEFLLVDPETPELGLLGPGELLARSVDHARRYLVEALPQSLAGPSGPGLMMLLAILVALALASLSLAGWARHLREVRPLEVFSAAYFPYLLLSPTIDRGRLLILLPAILIHAGAGIHWCLDFLRIRPRRWFVPASLAAVVVLAVPAQVTGVSYSQRCQQLYRQGDRLACYPPPWRAFFESALWTGDATASDAVVVSPEPRLFYLMSGRRGFDLPRVTDEGAFLARLDALGVDVVVLAGVRPTSGRYLLPVVRGRPERFEVRYSVGQGAALAYVLAYDRAAESNAIGEGD